MEAISSTEKDFGTQGARFGTGDVKVGRFSRAFDQVNTGDGANTKGGKERTNRLAVEELSLITAGEHTRGGG